MNRFTIVATLCLTSLVATACGEAVSTRPMTGAGLSAGGGIVGGPALSTLLEGAAIGIGPDTVLDEPASMNRMHIGESRGQGR